MNNETKFLRFWVCRISFSFSIRSICHQEPTFHAAATKKKSWENKIIWFPRKSLFGSYAKYSFLSFLDELIVLNPNNLGPGSESPRFFF